MPKPLRLPNAKEQAVLEGLSLRLLIESEDKQRWDQLVIEHHYLKNITGVFLVIGLSVMLINLLVDLSYGTLDPRVRYR